MTTDGPTDEAGPAGGGPGGRAGTALVQAYRRAEPLLLSALFPVGALGAIAGLELILRFGPFGGLAYGIFDWPAHVLTALLVLLAVVGPTRVARNPAPALTVLIAAVAIDIDHIPLYLGVSGIASHGRPFSHSAATVLLLLAVWAVAGFAGRRWQPLRWIAAGVALHLLRDVALGPGIPLWWPVSDVGVREWYGFYAAEMLVCAAVAAQRARRERRGHAP